MVEQSDEMTRKLLKLIKKTGYSIEQRNGQRKFGPPPDWTGPPPPKGCEVFVGKLPRDIFEDELVPLFSSVGKIYVMRLMMDFSGSNRGYAFVTYTTRSDASAAVKRLNGYQVRQRRHIGVVKSVDNCRLFIGNIPTNKTKEELLEELPKRVLGIVDVILYKNFFDRNLNRGFTFVEFESHKAAAMARRSLVINKLWDRELLVNWADPEPDIDDEQMEKVKVLHVRNFQIGTTPDVIQRVFESAINNKIERIKKIYDYAFIHFYTREHAELAMAKLQNAEVDGCDIEISWAKPVDRELYCIQKLIRGNAKFNTGYNFNWYNLNDTLILYKQHLDKKEYAIGSSKDECIRSAYIEDKCNSPTVDNCSTPKADILAPMMLESICKRYFWTQPMYNYQKYLEPTGAEVWTCTVDLPLVGLPLSTVPLHIGPLIGRACYTVEQAKVEAAEITLQTIKMLRPDIIEQPAQPVQPMYTPISPVHTCVHPQTLPLQVPSMW